MNLRLITGRRVPIPTWDDHSKRSGCLPAFEGIPSGFSYTYARRKHAGLDYYLETSTNLLSNAWTNSGYAALAPVGVMNELFESVTNTVPIDNDQTFIRLIIKER